MGQITIEYFLNAPHLSKHWLVDLKLTQICKDLELFLGILKLSIETRKGQNASYILINLCPHSSTSTTTKILKSYRKRSLAKSIVAATCQIISSKSASVQERVLAVFQPLQKQYVGAKLSCQVGLHQGWYVFSWKHYLHFYGTAHFCCESVFKSHVG